METGHQKFVVAGVVVAALALAGCNSSSPQENVSQACTEADSLTGSIEEFRAALTSEATVEEIRQARDAVVDSYNTFVAEAQDVAQDRMDDLETTIEQFRSAVDDVPEDTQLPDAVEDLRGEAAEVGTALEDLESELTC